MSTVEVDLLTEVLSCYKPHCRYLQEFAGGRGRFVIPESCYIDDTGHLNAVEVNICYNQLLYASIASFVREGTGPVFDTWTMAEFWRRRLPDILITRFTSEFRRPVDPRSFSGELVLDRIVSRRLPPDETPLVAIDTTFRFWDIEGGDASGMARIAIVDGATRG
jgi:hypothetical protein